MQIKDPVKFFSLLLNVILIAVVILLLKQCHCPPCYEAGQTVTVHDTIWPNPELKPIVVKVPEAYKAVAKKAVGKKDSHTEKIGNPTGLFSSTTYETFSDIGKTAKLSPCDSIRYYSDTTMVRMPDSSMIVVKDTLMDNKVAGRSVWFKYMAPRITTTITQVKKDKWKVYIGGAFIYNARNLDRWGAGPQFLLTVPKLGGFNYYYDAKNNAHAAGVMALIRFKK